MKTNVLQERNVNMSCLEAIPYRVQALWSQEAQGQAAWIWGGGAQHGATEDTNWEGLRKLWELTLFTSWLCLSDGSVVSATWRLHSSSRSQAKAEREKRLHGVLLGPLLSAVTHASLRSHRCVHTCARTVACKPVLTQMRAHLCLYTDVCIPVLT